MSAEGSAAGSWPLGQALRAYFLAFLPLDQVDDAVRRVGREAVGRGATGILAVFTIASEVLHAQVRLTPEVEALVLVDESRLLPDEAAMVLGLNPEQVEAALAEAHGPPDGAPLTHEEPPGAEPGAQVGTDWEPVAAEWEEFPAFSQQVEAERVDAERVDAEWAGAQESTAGPEVAAPDASLVQPGATAADEGPATEAVEGVGEPVRRSRRSRHESTMGPGGALRSRGPVLVGVAVAALLAGAVLMTAVQPAVTSATNPTPSATRVSADPIPSATPTAPGIPGLFDLRNAVLTDAVTDGRPGGAETAFTPSQSANLWIAFAYQGSATTDRLGVLWYRGEEVVFRDIFPLDQETGQQISTLAAPAKSEPGRYRADIFVNTQVVATVAFEVAG